MATLALAQRCLIVDDPSIGSSLLDDITAAGFEAVGPFPAPALALRWLEAQTPDLVVIDPASTVGAAQDLVLALRERGVPFVVYTDAERTSEVMPELQSMPWFEKGSGRAEFLATLAYVHSTAAA